MATKYAYPNGGYTDRDYATHQKVCPPVEERWKGAGNKHGEHECRPVIVDGKGNRRPVVCYKPSGDGETFVVASETIEERFTPPVTNHFTCSYPVRVVMKIFSYPVRSDGEKYSCPVRVEEEYIRSYIPPGMVDEQKYSSHHPSDYGYPVSVEEYKHVYGSPTSEKVKNEPKRSHLHPSGVEEYEHVYPVRIEEYNKHSPPASPVRGRPYGEVQQFFTQIQKAASQEPGRGPVSAGGSNWRQPHDDDEGRRAYYCNEDGSKKPTFTNSYILGRTKLPAWAVYKKNDIP